MSCSSSSRALQSVVDFGFQYNFQLYRLLNKFVFTGLGCQPNELPSKKKKGKGVPLHAMEAHGGRGGIAPIHT
jgi:hypothetical protein